MFSKAALLLGLSCTAYLVSARTVDIRLRGVHDIRDPDKVPKDVTANYIDGGKVTKAELNTMIATLPKAGDVIAARSDDASQNLQALIINTYGDASSMPELTTFDFFGPFANIVFSMGPSNIRGVKVTDLAGNVQEFVGLQAIDTQDFTFAANERITEISMALSGDPAAAGSKPFGVGVAWKTDANHSFKVEPTATCEQVPYVGLAVGSGIMGRIHGKASAGVVYEFGIDMIDELQSISITDMAYSGFTDNIAPSGPGSRLVVGSLIVNNLNSTSPQSITMQTTSAITTTTEISFSMAYTVGATITVAKEVDIPEIAKVTTSVAINWGLTVTTGDTQTTSVTKTDGALFPLVCSAHKFCTGSAFFNQYKLDVNVNATFTAVTKTNNPFKWIQTGNYKGADSTTIQLIVTESDVKD